MTSQNDLAATLKAAHRPSPPIIFANVHDAYTAAQLANNTALRPHVRGLATASYAVAETQGLRDAQMDGATNLRAVAPIAAAARAGGLPLSIDLQDAYDDPAETVRRAAAELGVVGANIEDSDSTEARAAAEKGEEYEGKLKLFDVEENVRRLKEALRGAKEAGVPDFVINARTDAIGVPESEGGGVDEAIRRGKKYLEAGATTVFVWSAGRKEDLSADEVKKLVEAFDGKLAVSAGRAVMGAPDTLSVKKLVELGVSRISIGPALWMVAMKAWTKAAEDLLKL